MPPLLGFKQGIYAALLASLFGMGCAYAADPADDIALGPETAAAEPEGTSAAPTTQTAAPAQAEPAQDSKLTLGDAVRQAVEYSAAVKAAYLEIEAKEGEADQAGSRPNPEFLVEVENFAGDGDQTGFDSAEETFGFAQTIELGAKRLKRLQAAKLDTSLASWDHEAVRVHVAKQAAEAFADVLLSQQRIEVLGEFTSIAEKTLASVDARVTGGKASPIEQDRAAVALARAQALQTSERVRLAAARKKLAAFWGAEQPDFSEAAGRLGPAGDVPAVEVLQARLDENPALARWTDEIDNRVALLELEQARAIPDLTLGVGIRHSNADDSSALVASLSMPFPVFDRNRGNIIAAERRVAKADNDRQAARSELYISLVEALGDLEVAATELRALEQDVLPGAWRAYERTKIGFDEGKFDILSVLDVQRTVFETRLEVLSARADYEKARVGVEALIGRDLNSLQERE